MNILFVIHTPKDLRTAVYRNYRERSAFLEARGHRAAILAPEDFPSLKRLGARWYPLLYPAYVARWLLAHPDIDLAVFHSYAGWMVNGLGRWLPPLRHLKTATAFHGLEPLHYQGLQEEMADAGKSLSLRYRIVHGTLVPWLIRGSCQRSDRVFCLNSGEAAYLTDHRWSAPASTFVVGNGVSREFFVERTFAPQVRRVLFVGQWLGRKGAPQLVRAFEQVAREWPDVELWCVGTLADEQTVLRDFSEPVRSRVQVRPKVERSQIRALYEQADIFVLPTYLEGSSLALLEAMAAGLPILTTPVGAAPDLLREGESALFVSPGDAEALAQGLDRLIREATLRERLGRGAQRAATESTWERVLARYAQLLEETAPLAVRPPRAQEAGT